MPGLTGGDNVWGVTGYTVVGAVMGAAFEVCLGREWNKPEEVKLKYLKTHNFAQLPRKYLEISSTYKNVSEISNT
jgi:heptaprenylglyceryl phosphate synthase